MRCTPSEIRTEAMSGLMLQLFSVLLTGFIFVLPLPRYLAVLLALGVAFAMAISDHLQAAMSLTKSRTLEQLWLGELTTRLGIEAAASAGGSPVRIDWQEITALAVADIRLHDQDLKMLDQLSSGGAIDAAFGVLTAIVPVAVRLVLGWGLAVLSSRFVPSVVSAITGV
ncbi:hypothetical protein NKI98_17875 [Mesorhizobium sp. M0222]|uniref:hypothetical protein n=1 Tax=Mesorhizobium sp. M0222 TaxID=2956921 RepID=UPI00333C5AE0